MVSWSRSPARIAPASHWKAPDCEPDSQIGLEPRGISGSHSSLWVRTPPLSPRSRQRRIQSSATTRTTPTGCAATPGTECAWIGGGFLTDVIPLADPARPKRRTPEGARNRKKFHSLGEIFNRPANMDLGDGSFEESCPGQTHDRGGRHRTDESPLPHFLRMVAVRDPETRTTEPTIKIKIP